MVVERVFLRKLAAFAVAFCVAIPMTSTGCVKRNSVTTTRTSGSCAGACSHYINCSGKDSKTVYAACVRECRFAYSDNGYEDKQTLGQIESFDCAEIISFVEGSSGRGPGDDIPTSAMPVDTSDSKSNLSTSEAGSTPQN